MAGEFSCKECGQLLGGQGGKDPYKHILRCLHVEPDSLQRIREQAEASRTENGRRVLHILDNMGDRSVEIGGSN